MQSGTYSTRYHNEWVGEMCGCERRRQRTILIDSVRLFLTPPFAIHPTNHPSPASKLCISNNVINNRGDNNATSPALPLITLPTIATTSCTEMTGKTGCTRATAAGTHALDASPASNGMITIWATERSSAIASIGIHWPASADTNVDVAAVDNTVDVNVRSTEYATSAPANKHTGIQLPSGKAYCTVRKRSSRIFHIKAI